MGNIELNDEIMKDIYQTLYVFDIYQALYCKSSNIGKQWIMKYNNMFKNSIMQTLER